MDADIRSVQYSAVRYRGFRGEYLTSFYGFAEDKYILPTTHVRAMI